MGVCQASAHPARAAEWIPESSPACVFGMEEDKLNVFPRVAWCHLYFSVAVSSWWRSRQGINLPSLAIWCHFCKPGSRPSFSTHSDKLFFSGWDILCLLARSLSLATEMDMIGTESKARESFMQYCSWKGKAYFWFCYSKPIQTSYASGMQL